MSIEAVRAFIKKVRADEALQKDLEAIDRTDRDAAMAGVVAVAEKVGFSFGVEDYEAAAEEMIQARHAAGEISDEDLDAVAGGLGGIETKTLDQVCWEWDPELSKHDPIEPPLRSCAIR